MEHPILQIIISYRVFQLTYKRLRLGFEPFLFAELRVELQVDRNEFFVIKRVQMHPMIFLNHILNQMNPISAARNLAFNSFTPIWIFFTTVKECKTT